MAHAVGSFEQKCALSERRRCETKENKVCLFVAMEFRHSNLETLLTSDAEISELCSIEWLGILRRATFASHYTNAHEESKGKTKTK